MPRGGYRKGAGRPRKAVSSTNGQITRVSIALPDDDLGWRFDKGKLIVSVPLPYPQSVYIRTRLEEAAFLGELLSYFSPEICEVMGDATPEDVCEVMEEIAKNYPLSLIKQVLIRLKGSAKRRPSILSGKYEEILGWVKLKSKRSLR